MPIDSIQDLSRLLVVRLPHRLPIAKIRISIGLEQPRVGTAARIVRLTGPRSRTAVTERERLLRSRPADNRDKASITPNRALALAAAVPGSGGSRTSCSGWALCVQRSPGPGARLAGGAVTQVGRVSLRVVCNGAGTCPDFCCRVLRRPPRGSRCHPADRAGGRRASGPEQRRERLPRGFPGGGQNCRAHCPAAGRRVTWHPSCR
jgi:hypothetical protein